MPQENIFVTQCCIVGGGPAGMMAGYLLARAGIDTIVIEKWPDFFRDFRGDTIHPSTLELMYELGLLDEFLKLPHNKTTQLSAKIGNDEIVIADFSKLKMHCPFIAFMPQWDFLNFIAEKAKKIPCFHLFMETEAIDLIHSNEDITGVIARKNNQQITIQSKLVIGADGRHAMTREKSHLTLESLSAPMDVLWFHLSRYSTDPKESFGRLDHGRMVVMIERGDYWQCGYLIRKGGYDNIVKNGIETFRNDFAELMPSMHDRVHEITSWDKIKLLTVCVDRLKKWYLPGLLCIGDAAHAMSPIGGVGINLAIQDAVAAANILIPTLRTDTLTVEDLKRVQDRREFPVKVIQRFQVFIQNHVIDKVLDNKTPTKVPFTFKLLRWIPYLRRLTAYLIGVGIRPEKIK